MEVKIENGRIIISMPIDERPSQSRKTILVASTNGAAKAAVTYKGKPVDVNLNAYYKP